MDVSQVFVKLSEQVVAFQPLLNAASWVIGTGLVAYGVTSFVRAAQVGSNLTWGRGFTSISIGSMFAGLPSAMNAMQTSLFGTHTIVAYTDSGASGMGAHAAAVIGAAVAIVRVVGWLGIMRGLYLLYAASTGHGHKHGYGAAAVHLVGGALAANVVKLAQVLQDTFGITMLPT